MINIAIENASELADKFDKLIEDLETLPIHAEGELLAWQLTDMNRARPVASWTHKNVLETVVWPRQYKAKPQPVIQKRSVFIATGRRRRTPKQRVTKMTSKRRQSMRPIVRVILMDRLVDRMYELRDRIVKWPRGKL